MTDHLVFLLLGLGSGAVYAALAMSLVVTYRSSGVVNFSTGAIALYVAYTFAFLRQGELLLPIPGLKQSVSLGAPLTMASAMAMSLVIAAVLGLVLYWLVFRPLRAASPVAKAVASIGVMLLVTSLLAQRVGTNPVSVDAILPEGVFSIGDVTVPSDRLWFAGVIVALGIALTILIRFTRFGLATRAVAESERGALVSGLSPDRIAAINWALSSVVAGLSGILIAPIVPLVPVSYTLFIIPALAAAMVGGFTKLGPAIAAGFAIGMLQSELTFLQSSYDWLPSSGLADLVPLVLILGLLILSKDRLPQRGSLATVSIGRAPRPRGLLLPVLLSTIAALVLLTATSGSMRAAVITSLILGIVGLSQVVVTGYAGQVSLAQLTLAGVSAFSLTRLASDAGVPFPIAPLLAALISMVVGVLVGLPALRLRGLPVAVVTLAMAVSLQSFWFNNADYNGGLTGAPIPEPSIFGIDLGIGAGEGYPRMAFGILCLVVLLLVGIGVATLRKSRLGASMLAVRANERSAAAAGIDVRLVKVAAFAIGSFVAGLGGAMMGYQQGVASANSYTALGGIALFATVYLAGVSSVAGGVTAGLIGAGGIVFLALDRWISLGEYFAVISGLLLVFTVVKNPEGIVGPLHGLVARIRARRTSAPTADDRPDVAPSSSPVIGDEILTVSGVGVHYGGVVALDDVAFTVREGEILGLIGPNGAGKTTLVDAMSGFARCTGTVTLEGRPLDGLAPHRRSRAGLGRTFQGIELYDDLTVRENVLVGTTAADHSQGGEPDLDRLFATLHLTPVADRTVAELSQGQRQLVSVARAVAGRPRVVLLDEPAAGLDSTESRWLGGRLQAASDAGVTVVMVEHDMGLVLEVCDRIVVLDLGKVIAVGTPDQIKTNPEVIRAYLGSSHTGTPTVEPALSPTPATTAEVPA